MTDAMCSVDDDTHSPGQLRHGMCIKHDARWRRYGDPLIVRSRWDGETPEDRFWAKVNKSGPLPEKRPELGPCWVWTGAKMGSGYGHVRLPGHSSTGAHRIAYELEVGPIPDDLELDHLCHPGDGSCPRATCRHRLCVNPAHLDPTTRFVNMKRGATFTAANVVKTHCPKGHEYTPENTRIRIGPSGNENRSCKECQRLSRPPTGKVNPLIAANAVKTHCPKGHEYTPENTIIDLSVGGKNGGRRCRTCRRAQSKASYQTRKVTR